jgi:uncharacterized membrane protein YqjE
MEAEGFEIFAEMSIAMLGFSGVMVAISKASATVVTRVKGLIFSASIAAVCSALPLTGLSLVLCSMGYIALVIVLVVWGYSSFYRNPAAQANKVIFFGLNGALLSAIVVLSYSVALAPRSLHQAYMYAIFAALLCSGSYFVRMVLFLVSERDSET